MFPHICPKCSGDTCLEPWGEWMRVKCLSCGWWECMNKDGSELTDIDRRRLKEWK